MLTRSADVISVSHWSKRRPRLTTLVVGTRGCRPISSKSDPLRSQRPDRRFRSDGRSVDIIGRALPKHGLDGHQGCDLRFRVWRSVWIGRPMGQPHVDRPRNHSQKYDADDNRHEARERPFPIFFHEVSLRITCSTTSHPLGALLDEKPRTPSRVPVSAVRNSQNV